MAGTDGDDTTSADWWLASDELAFVTKFVDSEERAKAFLLDGVINDFIRWRCATLTVVEKRDFQANPPVETPLAAANLFFWRRAEHSRIAVDWYVDWQTNCVVREGPVVRLGSDGMGNSFPIFDSRAPSSWTANLVRFHHGDVVTRLVTLGLIPRPPAPPPSSPPSPEPPIAPRVETAPAAPVSQDDLESKLPSAAAVPAPATTTTKRRLGSQEQWIAPVALEIYGEDLPLLSPAELQHAIETRQKAKTLKTPLPSHWVADWEACKRFLQKRGKVRSR
jgi:hypothetical protein